MLDPSGKILFNSKLIEALGYSQDELVGTPVGELCHPEDREKVALAIRNVVNRISEASRVELRFLKKDDSWAFLESVGRLYQADGFTGVLVSSRDMSEKLQLMEMINRSSELFKATFDMSRNLLSITRAGTGELLDVNEQWLKASGFTRDEVIGKRTTDLGIWTKSTGRHEFLDAIARDGYVRNLHTHSFAKNGDRLELIVDANLIEVDGEQCLLMSATNITEQRELEAQLRQAHKMEAMGQLTGGVAHDFNNILGIIYGNTELGARADAIDPTYVDAILKACDRGAALTQQLLAFSRKQALSPSAIDLHKMAEDLGPMFQRTLGANISIEVEAEPGLWRCMADVSQMETALVNLALNARDAMPGGGHLRIALSNHVAESDDTLEAGEYVMVRFTDSGTGMPPDVLEKVFEPFFTTKEVGKGTGLGLSMIFGFVNQSGGRVAIESEVDAGTTVTLLFPRVDGDADDDKKSAAPVSSGQGEHILLLEDNRELRRVIEMMLTRLNYRVSSAGDEIELEKLMLHGHQYDLMISDIMLPGEARGPEVAARVKKRIPDLKLLFISGYAKSALDDYDSEYQLIMKPFSSTELSNAIRTALGNAE